MVQNKDSEWWLAIRQPYLEGMLPYEYSVLLKVLKQLEVPVFNVFIEAASVSESALNNTVQPISNFFNKRFYKYSETGRDYHKELPPREGAHGKALFASEGNLLPSKTELNLAKKAKFDLYTITNVSFMELASYLSIRPRLFAVVRPDLADTSASVAAFQSFDHFQGEPFPVSAADEPAIPRNPLSLPYSATFDVVHSRDCIYDTASKVKEVLGLIDNVVVFEREASEVFFSKVVGENYKVEKAVRLNLKDFKTEETHTDLIKVTSSNGTSVLVISETLGY